jgi:hypothetical protein
VESEFNALDELRKMQAGKQRGAKCTAGLLARTLPEDERAAFAQALKDELIDSNTISVWLERKGYAIKRHTVARHRRRECQCNG